MANSGGSISLRVSLAGSDEVKAGLAQLGPAGSTSTFTSRDGVRLQGYYWPAAAAGPSTPPARGVVVFVHGHGSHALHELLAFEVGRRDVG